MTESFNSEKEKESEHMLAVFMEDLVTLSKDLEGFYAVYDGIKGDKGKRRIAIHFPTFYSIWAENYRRKGLDPFKRGTILSYIKEEPYFIEDNYLKRINGKPIRTLVLSLDKEDNTPSGLSYFDPKSEIAEAVTNAGDGSDVLGPPPDSSLDFGDPPI